MMVKSQETPVPNRPSKITRLALPSLLLICWVSPAFAFYNHVSDSINQEARGLLYAGSGYIDNKTAAEVSARLMYNADFNNYHMEYHQVWQKRFATENVYQTQADRLNLSFSNESIYIKIGRQPINLATTFYFSPNDFFGSFSVQTFNRDYKQGVDAIYTELRLGELSQLSALAVNNTNENLPTSSILRFESASENISWMILAGEINSQTPFNPLIINQTAQKQTVVGGSIQTDIFDNIGIRAEGHISKQRGQTIQEWVLGLEHYSSSDLTLNMEWFNHGAKIPTSSLPYAGSQYLALGLSYIFTPLLSGSFSSIFNMDDHSQLHTAYLNYSLSNESTFNVYMLQPSKKNTTTEFGNYSPVAGLELFFYF